jgi:GDP-D-mannose dehydratase
MKLALSTGITSQEWAYLADFLLEKGYMFLGIRRKLNHLYLMYKESIIYTKTYNMINTKFFLV